MGQNRDHSPRKGPALSLAAIYIQPPRRSDAMLLAPDHRHLVWHFVFMPLPYCWGIFRWRQKAKKIPQLLMSYRVLGVVLERVVEYHRFLPA